MAAMTPNINQARAMRVAVRRIEGFAKQFGEAHRNLARHAAFPLVLTPDLLYQIWANFVPEAPWTAVAHLLLSRLCRQVGYEMYEMDIADRNLLLRELKEKFGQEHLDKLGEFLLDYVAQRLTDDDPDTQDLAQAQEWTVLAYTKPNEAARELAEALSSRVRRQDMAEIFRLASLVETFAEPLMEFGFEPLLVYARGMGKFVLGNQEQATVELSKLVAGWSQVGRWNAAYALGKIGSKSEKAIPSLINALKDKNSFVRGSAASALGKIGSKSEKAIPSLINALEDEASDVRHRAADALGNIGSESEKAISALIKALEDRDSNMRRRVASALGEIGSQAKKIAQIL